VLALREQFADGGKWVYFNDLGLEIIRQLLEKRETKEHPYFVGMWQACWGASLSDVLGALLANGSPGALAGVRKDDKPWRPSSVSDARDPLSGAAAGASTAMRLTLHPISISMRRIAATTSRAAFSKGAAAVISLLPTPRGISAARCFGITSGVIGRPGDAMQIGSRFPVAHATSMPM
jgi:hypothetical protein